MVPILDPNRGTDRIVCCNKTMYQSQRGDAKPAANSPKNNTKTLCLIIDISKLGNHGEEFEIVTHAIYINGTQDQTVRNAKSDWWGTRIHPHTQRANLAVILPKDRQYSDVQRVKRVEVVPKQWKTQEVNKGDEGYEPGGEQAGSVNGGYFYIWEIPCEPKNPEGYDPTVYSINWKWSK